MNAKSSLPWHISFRTRCHSVAIVALIFDEKTVARITHSGIM